MIGSYSRTAARWGRVRLIVPVLLLPGLPALAFAQSVGAISGVI
jgi:hypothetical protein